MNKNSFNQPDGNFSFVSSYQNNYGSNHNQLIQNQINDSHDSTLESSRRTLQVLAHTNQTGIKTAEELSVQGEKLARAENRLDQINQIQKETGQSIKKLKSFTSFFTDIFKSSSQISSPNVDKCQNPSQANVQDFPAQQPNSNTQNLSTTYSNQSKVSDTRHEEFQNNLNQMSSYMESLKNLSITMNQELTTQNQRIDRMNDKTVHVEAVTKTQTEALNKLLKK